ncbi:MAG: hypothetical protein V4548_05895 [Bacteroidota bacterium]
MRNHQKHKRIFYVPGMISLVLLPLLCLYYFYGNRAFTTNQSFQLTLNDTVFIENPKKEMFGNDLYNPKRDYKSIILNGSEELDKNKLKEARFEINQIYNSKDSIKGIKFVFGNKAIYKTFVEVLDVLTIDNVEYLTYPNEIYVLYVPKHHSGKVTKGKIGFGLRTCGIGEYGDYYNEKRREEEFKLFLSYYKQKWQILLAYLGIVILNIFALVKFNKNRKFNQKTYI